MWHVSPEHACVASMSRELLLSSNTFVSHAADSEVDDLPEDLLHNAINLRCDTCLLFCIAHVIADFVLFPCNVLHALLCIRVCSTVYYVCQ